MSRDELEQEVERIRQAFQSAVANGTDGKALAQRWNEIQQEIGEQVASGRG